MYGLTFHVLTPLQDQFGIITPSSLFYVATHRGSYVPEINPSEHRLMQLAELQVPSSSRIMFGPGTPAGWPRSTTPRTDVTVAFTASIEDEQLMQFNRIF